MRIAGLFACNDQALTKRAVRLRVFVDVAFWPHLDHFL